MTHRNTARARHRADVPPTTFLTNSRLSAFALRGTLGVATAGLAFGLVAPGASANAGDLSGAQGGGSASASSAGAGSAGSTSTGGGTSEGGTTVTVSAGDTVGEIAAEHGSSVSAIIDANDLSSSALIFVGDELTIPGGSGSTEESSAVDGGGTSGGGEVEESSSSSGASNEILDIARQYIGTPYVWGGSSPSGFDCSGFTQYVFAQVGIDLPRTTDAQYGAGTVVSASEAQPGDLVWWPGHVGIYTGDGQHIAARNPGTPLEEGPIWNDSPTFIRVA